MTLIGNVKHIEQGRRARERVFFVLNDDLICTLQGQHVALMLLNTSIHKFISSSDVNSKSDTKVGHLFFDIEFKEIMLPYLFRLYF